MKLHRILIGVVAGSILMLGTGTAVQAQGLSIDPGLFRERMIEWARVSEPSGNLAGKIAALSDVQIATWMASITDPEKFLSSIEVVTLRLQLSDIALPSTGAATVPVPPASATTLTTPFDPDYPPNTGAYKDVIINAIAAFGIGGATSTDRCLAKDWGDFIGVWWPLNKAFDALDGACVVAGCDPTGIACGITCGILETAKVALKIAAVPLEACDVHQGAIDGAEIEATYENTLGLVGDVSHVHGDLETHDADIKARLAALQSSVDANSAKLDTLLARQLEVIRLIHTPDGRRTSDVPACNGGSCAWNK